MHIEFHYKKNMERYEEPLLSNEQLTGEKL